MKTNATISELQAALAKLNEKYDGNISFETLEPVNSKRNTFTLKAKTGLKGSRISGTGRRLPKASWHAHGDFFDILFSMRDDIYILSLGKKITKDAGNWEDRNIGSQAFPMQFSEASIE